MKRDRKLKIIILVNKCLMTFFQNPFKLGQRKNTIIMYQNLYIINVLNTNFKGKYPWIIIKM